MFGLPDDLLTLPTALFGVGLYVVALIIRRVFEALLPGLSTKTPLTRGQLIWEGVVLPGLPALLGSFFAAWVTQYPYPAVVAGQMSLRVLFGGAVGWFSSWVYKIVKFVVKQKYNVPFPDDTLAPPANPDIAAVNIPPPPEVPRV